MSTLDRTQHWDHVYATKRETEVSWFEPEASLSHGLIRAWSGSTADALIDIGGGASRLVDALLEAGYSDVTVLDLSKEALEASKRRLCGRSSDVNWIVADVTDWQPSRRYHIWHDRAAFHFLTAANDQVAYVARLENALHPGAYAIIGTFALNGPAMCSGLSVARYDAETLGRTLGSGFALIETRPFCHRTPLGRSQQFQFSVFRRRDHT
jgi:2-polyprenyl-3-methyl-5-hydroxy-6-metoxy-1,4-benzoquinol methylase